MPWRLWWPTVAPRRASRGPGCSCGATAAPWEQSVAAGSNIDLTAQLKKPLKAEEVNAIFREASEGRYLGLVGYTEDQIVSSDVIGNYCSAVIDASATMVSGCSMVKVVGWFDNGWAYAARMLELARHMLLGAEAEGGVIR